LQFISDDVYRILRVARSHILGQSANFTLAHGRLLRGADKPKSSIELMVSVGGEKYHAEAGNQKLWFLTPTLYDFSRPIKIAKTRRKTANSGRSTKENGKLPLIRSD
jgi:hypothetical protein